MPLLAGAPSAEHCPGAQAAYPALSGHSGILASGAAAAWASGPACPMPPARRLRRGQLRQLCPQLATTLLLAALAVASGPAPGLGQSHATAAAATTSAASAEGAVPSQPPQAAALIACLAAGTGDGGARSCATSPTTWQHLLRDEPSCLTAHRAWWPAPAADADARAGGGRVTLLTHLSLNRMAQLKAQCDSWAGPLAAVLYAPLRRRGGAADFEPDAELSEAVATVAAWFDAAMARAAAGGPAGSVGGCTPRVLLIYEVFDSDKAAGLLYPVNSLRNLARLMADTPLVASIDVDMLPSASLSAALTDGSHVAALEASCTGKERRVYVLPAFETRCVLPAFET
eukprot:364269-Chlamydomonas_euryale.AAC.9